MSNFVECGIMPRIADVFLVDLSYGGGFDMKLRQPIWYRKIEQWLSPSRKIATLLLIGIAAVSIIMLFVKSNLIRSSWITYVFMP